MSILLFRDFGETHARLIAVPARAILGGKFAVRSAAAEARLPFSYPV
jgi:hypothetical protein